MRVLVNGMPMLGRLTGVGQYARRLVEGLQDLPDVDEVDIFDGNDIIALPAFLRGLRGHAVTDRHEKWKKLVRSHVPFCREMVARYRASRFQKESRRGKWAVYHEPNYVSQQYSGVVVTTICDMSFIRYPHFLPKDRLQWLRRNLRNSISRSDAIIAISQFTRREILDLCPEVDPARVFVTPLGIDPDYAPLTAPDAASKAARRHLRLPPKFILYLGTLEPRKNLQGLLTAFRQLPDEVQRTYPLVLAGTTGWREHYFRRSINDLNRKGLLYELGYVDRRHVPSLMRAASVFCFPSFYEGFGLPPLEAAACGTPVVCSNAASLPEVMGDAAVYVDPNSTKEMAAALLIVLEDAELRSTLRKVGPKHAAQFTWEKCVYATVTAYRSAA